jgi:nucleotide-binding universal stress UspA family protein
METVRQLVAGSDFSACADQALALALRLAKAGPARVTIVHVCEPDAEEQYVRGCGEALSELVAKHRRSGVDISGLLRSGKPWKKLDNVATEVGASLIVIGRHGGGRGRSVAIGSVAEQLVRTASRPVLTVACDFDCLA